MRQNTDLPTNTGSVQFVKATNNSTLQQQGRQATPLGVWAAIGDRGADKNRVQSHIHIYEEEGVLCGTVVAVFHNPGGKCDQNPDAISSSKCPGDLASRPVLGMRLMWGFRETRANRWQGKIVDPHTGRVYRCVMRMQGADLRLRGYAGIPLFGRTQTWLRLE